LKYRLFRGIRASIAGVGMGGDVDAKGTHLKRLAFAVSGSRFTLIQDSGVMGRSVMLEVFK